MGFLKRALILFLVLLTTAIAQQAHASPLPVSSYATAQQNWQGSRLYSGTTNSGYTVSCRVDYAVYDTLGSHNTAEGTFLNSIDSVMPDMEQYLYVYQIFNDLTDSEASLVSFAIFNLDETELNVSGEDIGAADDGEGGIEPTDSSLADNNTRIVWNFAGQLILQDEHSWFLLVSSSGAPVKGNFDIEASESDPGMPPIIPEPAAIALFSATALIIAGKRKRK